MQSLKSLFEEKSERPLLISILDVTQTLCLETAPSQDIY